MTLYSVASVLLALFHEVRLDPYKDSDKMPNGTPVPDGYAGATFAHDHDHTGHFIDGPKPPQNPLARLQGVTASQPYALPPQLARLCLTLEARRSIKLRSVVARSGKKLAPLVLGRKRWA